MPKLENSIVRENFVRVVNCIDQASLTTNWVRIAGGNVYRVRDANRQILGSVRFLTDALSGDVVLEYTHSTKYFLHVGGTSRVIIPHTHTDPQVVLGIQQVEANLLGVHGFTAGTRAFDSFLTMEGFVNTRHGALEQHSAPSLGSFSSSGVISTRDWTTGSTTLQNSWNFTSFTYTGSRNIPFPLSRNPTFNVRAGIDIRSAIEISPRFRLWIYDAGGTPIGGFTANPDPANLRESGIYQFIGGPTIATDLVITNGYQLLLSSFEGRNVHRNFDYNIESISIDFNGGS